MDKAFLCFKCTKDPEGHILSDGGFWLTSCFHVFCTGCNALIEEQKKCLFCNKICKSMIINADMDSKLKELFTPLDLFVKERMKKMQAKLVFQEELRKHYVKGFNKKKADYAQALEYCKKSNQMSKQQTEQIDQLKRQVIEMSTTLKRNEADLEYARQKIADYEVQLSERSSNSYAHMQSDGDMGESTMEHLFKQPKENGTSLNMSSFFRPSITEKSQNSMFDELADSNSAIDSMFAGSSQLTDSQFGMNSQSDTMSFRLGSPERNDLSMQSEMTTPKLLGVHRRTDYGDDPMFADSPTRTTFQEIRRPASRKTPTGRLSRSPGLSLGASASSSRHKSPGASLGFHPGVVTSNSIILKNSF